MPKRGGRPFMSPRYHTRRNTQMPHRYRDSPPDEHVGQNQSPNSDENEVSFNFQNHSPLPQQTNIPQNNAKVPDTSKESNENGVRDETPSRDSPTNSNSENDNIEAPKEQESTNVSDSPKSKSSDENEVDDEDLSDVDEGAIENSIGEQIHLQCERLFDLIEDIDRVNQSKWVDCNFQHEAFGKLQMFIEKMNRIKKQSIETPEFLERRPMRDQPGYEYIPRILNAWNIAKARITAAKQIVMNLPAVNPKFTANQPGGDVTKDKRPKGKARSSTSSILEERIRDFRNRGEEFDKRMNDFSNRATENVQHIYGTERGQAVNDLLNKRKPPYRTETQRNSNSENIRVLPRGVQDDEFLRKHPRSKAPSLWREGDEDLDLFDQASIRSNISLPLRNSNPPKSKNPTYRNWDFGFTSKNRNPLPPPEDDWVEVATTKHPESNKPKHYGKILCFKNLFMNSFQEHQVYNPTLAGCAHNTTSKNINIRVFDGERVEFFREFEQGILMKAVNNITEDWDGKFFTLMNSTSGVALQLVHSYTDQLTMANFVQAIEDLYYNYGRPHEYRNELTYRLLNDQFIDLKKPKTLLSVNALITKILRVFDTDINGITGEAYLSQTFISKSVKMSEEAKTSFNFFLMARERENNLKSLRDWLTYTYRALITDSANVRHQKGIKSFKPTMMGSHHEEESHSDPSDDEESKEVVAFSKPNGFPAKRELEHRNSNFRVTNIRSNYPGDSDRCDLCFDEKHKYANCRVFAFLTPDQRKLWLLTRNGCYACTEIGHSASKCMSQRKCLNCQSQKHHELICDAVANSWEATKTKKWNKTAPKSPSSEKVPSEEKSNEQQKTVHFLEEEEGQ